MVDRHPDREARNLAFDVFRRLENFNAMTIGAETDAFGESGVPFFRFAPAAQERFNEWMTVRENRLRRGEEHPAMESHLVKYRKLIPAMSLLIHLAEGQSGPVRDDSLARAIRWGEVLGSHARRIYSCGIEPGSGPCQGARPADRRWRRNRRVHDPGCLPRPSLVHAG